VLTPDEEAPRVIQQVEIVRKPVRIEERGGAYFEFITTQEIGPTNNLAEQAIRFVVIDRHITQGTRGEKGRQWCERIWTTVATCAAQGPSAYTFLVDAVQAHFRAKPPPSLLFDATKPLPLPASQPVNGYQGRLSGCRYRNANIQN